METNQDTCIKTSPETSSDSREVYANQSLRITKHKNSFFIESFQAGMTIQELNKILTDNPEIKITSFAVIRTALMNAPQPPAKFGELKDRISTDISSNDMSLHITINLDDEEFMEAGANQIATEILTVLQAKGIVYGIKRDVLFDCLVNNTQLLIAEGLHPVNGEDSIIRMYEMKDPKPELDDNEKANYYDLNLINKVSAGAWLGERTDPTDGTPGKTIKGDLVKPLPGRRLPLFYDPKTVREEYKDGVTTLYSLINGAVHYEGGRISISNLLEITGDVGFSTGNIDFDGFLTVKGGITDNFSVIANKDIEILGEFGVGSVKEIESKNGSVYIKGGIAGKNKAVIRSSKDLYTKFISDATVYCDGTVHVGYYCLNSTIYANQLFIESAGGKIIGGSIQATQKIAVPYLGNPGEKRTRISVEGFDRKLIKTELEKQQSYMETAKLKLNKAKQLFSIYAGTIDTGSRQYAEYEAARETYFSLRDEMIALEKDLKALISCFKVKGEGEISISKKLYPNTVLEMKKLIIEIRKETLATCYFLQEGEIRKI